MPTEVDTPRETVIAFLRRIASFVRAPVRHVVEDEVIEVSPSGDVKHLEGAVAESITQALEGNTGSDTYGAFEYLEGFEIVVPGDFAGEFLDDLPGDNEFEVRSLGELRERLNELIENEEIKERSRELHRTLRRMCDVAERLQLPLVVGT